MLPAIRNIQVALFNKITLYFQVAKYVTSGGINNKAVYSLPKRVIHLFPNAFILASVLNIVRTICMIAIKIQACNNIFPHFEKSLCLISTKGNVQMLAHIPIENINLIGLGARKKTPQIRERVMVAYAAR